MTRINAVLLRVFDGMLRMGLVPYKTPRYTDFSLQGHEFRVSNYYFLDLIFGVITSQC